MLITAFDPKSIREGLAFNSKLVNDGGLPSEGWHRFFIYWIT